ncbi:C-8 sterol isomerase [Nostoc sp. DSM 114161]|jgi:C-8 sterol isomerase|uniref:hypothetical protein n=1 Tax=Nostoc sp. DSM 114161 TaxID=3440143 RepID=UPI0040467868
MSYLFDPDILHEIAKKGIGLPYDEMFETVRSELEQKYPGHIAPKVDWIVNCAGGSIFSIAVLHASLNEYVLIFGNSIGTSGHTGRHFTDTYSFVIDGEVWYFSEERPFERMIRRTGDKYRLEKFQSRGLCIKDRAWVVEYARGPISLMLPFGLAGFLFSTLDLKNLVRTLWTYGKLTMKELLFRLRSTRSPVS